MASPRRFVVALLVTIHFLLLPAAIASAQQPLLAGTVRDETGAALPGVLVEVRAGTTSNRACRNRQRGRYRFVGLARGRSELTFTLVNFATVRRTITVGSDQQTVDAIMHLVLSADVTVTAKSTFTNLADAPDPSQDLVGIAQSASQGAVTGRQLETRPIMRPGEILETVPGVVISQHSGEGKANQYYLRGFNLDHGTDFATTVAGMPVNMPTHGHGHGYSDLNFLIPELASGVQFSKGPYFAEHGDFATAGAATINYTNTLAKPIVRISGGGDGFGRALVAAAPSIGSGTLLGALELETSHGPWERPDDLEKFNALVRFSRGDTRNGFSATFMGYRATWNATDQVPQRAIESGQLGRFGLVDASDGGNSSRYSGSIEWQRTNGNASTKLTAYGLKYDLDLFSNFTYFLDDPVNGDQFQQTDHRFVTGGRLTHRRIGRWTGRPVQNTIGVQVRNDDIADVGLYHTRQLRQPHRRLHADTARAHHAGRVQSLQRSQQRHRLLLRIAPARRTDRWNRRHPSPSVSTEDWAAQPGARVLTLTATSTVGRQRYQSDNTLPAYSLRARTRLHPRVQKERKCSMKLRKGHAGAIAALVLMGSAIGQGSSHREAPGITKTPKLDGTDFYMFRSYEAGRSNYVTLVANYIPLQDPYGGPNYFSLDPAAVYEIHIDNDGDAIEDLTFQFRPQEIVKDLTVQAGDLMVPVPLINIGPIGPGVDDVGALNRRERYSVNLIRGDRRKGVARAIRNAADGSTSFRKPVDNIGTKSIPQYATYANNHIYDIEIPGCENGRMFVGQRKDSFVVNLGETFDLVNVSNPLGAENAEADDLADKNVTSFILEVPISCLTSSSRQPIIGGWTTASLNVGPVNTFGLKGPGTQVSRLGSPLVNEVVVGLRDKDFFNSAEPKQDAALAAYVTNPTLPELLEILFGGAGVRAPNNFPRRDLVAAFLTGIKGLNRPANVVASEMLRLNTSTPVVAMGSQSRLGALGGDLAGFPNGRRPGDDVVDIELRVAMGVLCHAFPGAFACGPADAPSGLLPFTDGAFVDASFFDGTFPYLKTPLPGSPNSTN